MEGTMRPALGEERMLLWGESLAGNSEEQGTGKHTIISKVPGFDVAPNRKPTWPARCTASLAGCFHAPGWCSEIRVYLNPSCSLCLTLRASSETRTSSKSLTHQIHQTFIHQIKFILQGTKLLEMVQTVEQSLSPYKAGASLLRTES